MRRQRLKAAMPFDPKQKVDSILVGTAGEHYVISQLLLQGLEHGWHWKRIARYTVRNWSQVAGAARVVPIEVVEEFMQSYRKGAVHG